MMNQFKILLRWMPLIVIIVLFALTIYFNGHKYLTFDQLKQHHQTLILWTNQHYFISTLIFMAVYIIAVAISIPGAFMLTIIGGFLFGYLGTIYVVLSASIGATLIFLAVKTSIGQWLKEKAARWVDRLEKGFQKNALSYLLFLRLVPLFPFWVVNIVPALLNVRLRPFFFATLIGIIPGSFVYVSLGAGLQNILLSKKTPDLNIIFNLKILLPILALALLSLSPIIYKKLKRS